MTRLAGLASLILITLASLSAKAESESIDVTIPKVLEGMEVFGDFEYYPSAPGVLHLYDDINPGQEFEFRKALNTHSIHTLVLNSPGGAVSSALNIAGAVHDRQISTYVAKNGQCASACSFIFLAGKKRELGPSAVLGVHQFSPGRSRVSESSDVYQRAQTVMSNILGMISTFDVPPFVSIRMLETPPDEMYYFSSRELGEIAKGSARSANQINAISAARAAYILALVEAKKAKTVHLQPPNTQSPTTAPQRLGEKQAPALDQLSPPYPNQSNSIYALQLASFRDQRNAKALMADLSKGGYEGFTRTDDTFIKVYVYAGNASTARQMNIKLKEVYSLWGQIIRLENSPALNTTLSSELAMLSFKLVDVTWVNIIDSTGKVLFNGLAERGRNLELEGALPISVLIGRADAVEIFLYNGQALDLKPHTRKNVARLTLE